MRRLELEHVLRAASQVLGERDLLVIGSASILGTFPESMLPDAATRSDEADIASFDDVMARSPHGSTAQSESCRHSTGPTVTTARESTPRRRNCLPTGAIGSSCTETGTRRLVEGYASNDTTALPRNWQRFATRIGSSQMPWFLRASRTRTPSASGSARSSNLTRGSAPEYSRGWTSGSPRRATLDATV